VRSLVTAGLQAIIEKQRVSLRQVAASACRLYVMLAGNTLVVKEELDRNTPRRRDSSYNKALLHEVQMRESDFQRRRKRPLHTISPD